MRYGLNVSLLSVALCLRLPLANSADYRTRPEGAIMQWTIYNVSQVGGGSKASATRSEVRYRVDFLENGTFVSGLQLMRGELRALLAHYGVKRLSDLRGKTFTGRSDGLSADPDNALLLIIHETMTGQEHHPPGAAKVYSRYVGAFARLECPSFPRVDYPAVERAFDSLRGESPQWLMKFKGDIAAESGGRVLLKDADQETFAGELKCAAEYMLLVRGREKRLVAVCGGGPPLCLDALGKWSSDAAERPL